MKKITETLFYEGDEFKIYLKNNFKEEMKPFYLVKEGKRKRSYDYVDLVCYLEKNYLLDKELADKLYSIFK